MNDNFDSNNSSHKCHHCDPTDIKQHVFFSSEAKIERPMSPENHIEKIVQSNSPLGCPGREVLMQDEKSFGLSTVCRSGSRTSLDVKSYLSLAEHRTFTKTRDTEPKNLISWEAIRKARYSVWCGRRKFVDDHLQENDMAKSDHVVHQPLA
jgi:hypothetical protein